MKPINFICRELRAMQARPVSTHDFMGVQILDNGGGLYARIQDHLRHHHNVIAFAESAECDAVNGAVSRVSTVRSYEHICGNPDYNNCWPRRAGRVEQVVWYRIREWNRALERASEVAARMPDDDEY